jgi:hypothetical protein
LLGFFRPDQAPQLIVRQMMDCLPLNETATVSSKPVVLSITGLQTLQSSAQRRHGAVSASPKRIVGTDGVGPGRSSHSYQSKFGDLVGSRLRVTM